MFCCFKPFTLSVFQGKLKKKKEQMFHLICCEFPMLDISAIKEDYDSVTIEEYNSVPKQCEVKKSDAYCAQTTGASVDVRIVECNSVPKVCEMKKSNAYCVEATGASVDVDSSISLVYGYCQKLGHKHLFVRRPGGRMD
ncbi:unnamed protein product [Cuscuta epithymum]|uniref:Uncharacterized protein n=1 Tax=Cuscuta epithymum TaxID=186058 RepID=A0AAV0CRA1_9ASTE|nr:unnamed protein product [Cuscuta epithymum]